MKKNIYCTLSLVVILLFSFCFSFPPTSWGDSEYTNVTIAYTDWETLSSEQQATIQSGLPKEQLLHDEEDYIFVYKKNTVASNTLHTPITTNYKNTHSLPQTNETITPYYLKLSILTLIFLIAFLLLWEKRTQQKMMLFLLVLGGLGWVSTMEVDAAEQIKIPTTLKQQHAKGITLTTEPAEIPGYTYVGYVYTTKDIQTIPKPDTTGAITVYYETVDQVPLAEPINLTDKIGTSYRTEAKEFDGYIQKEVQGAANGLFTKEKHIVRYLYEPVSEKSQTVTVRYLNEDGEEIHEAKTISGKNGESYDATTPDYKLTIDGYVLDESKQPKNAVGVLDRETQTVTYVYQKKGEEAQLIMRFVDKDGQPFVIKDLTKMKNGDFASLYPHLDQYALQLDYNHTFFHQNETVTDIVIPVKIGQSYALPQNVFFNIYDEKKQRVPYLISQNPDDSSDGIRYWTNFNADIPANYSGTIETTEVVVTYIITGYAVVFSAP